MKFLDGGGEGGGREDKGLNLVTPPKKIKKRKLEAEEKSESGRAWRGLGWKRTSGNGNTVISYTALGKVPHTVDIPEPETGVVGETRTITRSSSFQLLLQRLIYEY